MTRDVRQLLIVVALAVTWACGPAVKEQFEQQYQKGLADYQAGRRTDAITAYRAALRLRPDAATVHRDLGVALYDVGDTDAAIQEYRRALRLDPRSAETHNDLGVALLSAGQIASAVGEYQQAIALHPELAEAQFNLCLGLEVLGRLQDALSHCRLAAQREPTRPGLTEAIERVQGKLARR